MKGFLAFACTLLLAIPACAQEDDPPLPRERPEAGAVPDDAVSLPRERPDEAEEAEDPVEATDAEPAEESEGPIAGAEERPPALPPRTYQTACPAVLSGAVEAEMLEPLEDGICAERSPLAVSGILVNGRMLALSGEAVLNCAMASTLPDWAAAVDGYLEGRENTRLERILVGTSQACRPRNDAAGADMSEHGFANALDVIGFSLEDGRTITLPEGWTDPDSAEGRLMRFAHGAACARFTTVLGPEANAAHEDHLHLDLGCHGGRCTARICE